MRGVEKNIRRTITLIPIFVYATEDLPLEFFLR